jgi:hypothetical protein
MHVRHHNLARMAKLHSANEVRTARRVEEKVVTTFC